MTSSLRIDFVDRGTGRGIEPLIRADLKGSDDPRDKLLSTLFQSLSGNFLQISYSNHRWTGVKDGDVISETSVYLFKPEESPKGCFLVHDNSDGFRKFLDSASVEYRGEDHSTVVYLDDPNEIFKLGRKLEQYKAANP